MSVCRTSPARRPGVALAALCGLLSAATVCSEDLPATGRVNQAQALATSQGAIGRQIGDYRLTDQFGRPLSLVSLRGRPVLVSFVYTSCAFSCPTLTSRLNDVAKVARAALGGGSFSIVTVGFDTRVDNPERMRRFAQERGIDMPDWYFAAADQATADRLASATGFVFAPAAGGFDHFAQVTIVDGSGRVFRQVYGEEFEPPLIVEPLKTLLLGTVDTARPASGWLATVRLLCTTYDPRSGRYRFDYSLILEIMIGAMCTLAISIFLVRAWVQARGPGAPS